MKRGRKPDRLSLWAAAALEAGMSYGQYVASVPLSERPGFQEPEDVQATDLVPERSDYRVCPVCGKEFQWVGRRPNQKYCSHGCQMEANRIQNRDLKRRRRAEALAAAGKVQKG